MNQSVRWMDRPSPATNAAAPMTPGRHPEREGKRLERKRNGGEHTGDKWPARPHPDGNEAAEDGADAGRRQDRGPRAGPAELGIGDRRAEHDPTREHEVSDPEEEDRRPEPGASGELAPPLTQLRDESRRIASASCNPDSREKHRADEERDRVDGEGDARARRDDEDTTDGRAQDADEVPRQALERVGLLEPLVAHGLVGRGRPLPRDQPEAVDGLQDDDRSHPAYAAEHAARR